MGLNEDFRKYEIDDNDREWMRGLGDCIQSILAGRGGEFWYEGGGDWREIKHVEAGFHRDFKYRRKP